MNALAFLVVWLGPAALMFWAMFARDDPPPRHPGLLLILSVLWVLWFGPVLGLVLL